MEHICPSCGKDRYHGKGWNHNNWKKHVDACMRNKEKKQPEPVSRQQKTATTQLITNFLVRSTKPSQPTQQCADKISTLPETLSCQEGPSSSSTVTSDGASRGGGDGDSSRLCVYQAGGGESVVPVVPQAGDGEDHVLLPTVSSEVHVFEPEVLLEEKDCPDELPFSGVQTQTNMNINPLDRSDSAPDLASSFVGDSDMSPISNQGAGNTLGEPGTLLCTDTSESHGEPLASKSDAAASSCASPKTCPSSCCSPAVIGASNFCHSKSAESTFPDISSDPASFCNLSHLEPEMSSYIRAMGPSQPQRRDLVDGFPKDKDNRSFHEAWFWRTLPGGDKARRSWMSYSFLKDRVFCIDCMLFGDKRRVSKAWARDGFRTWSTGTTSIIAHEASVCHVEASLKAKLRDSPASHVDSSMELGRKPEIAENREIVKHLTDAVLYLGTYNLAFRGHREKSAELNRGNYVDLVYLLAKYSPPIAAYLSSLEANKPRKKHSFITWENQNYLINAVSRVIKEEIQKHLKDARFFSLSMDTTFDFSRREQLAVVVRYVDEDSGRVCERLIGIRECSSTKGKSMFKIFAEVANALKLEWEELLVGQSYDGASNMSGDFNGLKAHIQNVNSAAIFIWCCAHRLNLVIAEVASVCINARDLFSIFQSMFVFVCSSKNKVKVFEDNQKKCYPKEPVRRLKRVKTTRWMSQASFLDVGLKKVDALAQTLLDITQVPLRTLNPEDPTDKVTDAERSDAVEAQGYLKYILSERFLLTALMSTKIFEIVGPVNKILQGKDIDLIVASAKIQEAIADLKKLRTEVAFNSFLREKNKFLEAHPKLDFESLPNPRKRRRKMMPGELAQDESVDDPVAKFRVETYYGSLDAIIGQLEERFDDMTSGLFCDLALFTNRRFSEVNGEREALPTDSFKYFCQVYGKFVDENQLWKDYLSFSKVYPQFKKAFKLPENLHPDPPDDQLNDRGQNTESEDCESSEEEASSIEEREVLEPVAEKRAPSNSGSLSTVLNIMRAAGLKEVFPTLYTAIKIAVTVSVASVTPERTFSKLKVIKNRLRTTIGSSRLEDLLLISCERDTARDIDYDSVKSKFVSNNPNLAKLLLY